LATEDFTTYTEVDPDTEVTVISSTISWANLECATESRVHYDKGVGHFGDFEQLFDIYIDSASTLNSEFPALSLSNILGYTTDFKSGDDALQVILRWINSAETQVYIYDRSNDNSDKGNIGVDDTWYYLTWERDDTTLTCKCYSDESRETLLDTLTITCETGTKRYIYGMVNHGSSSGDYYTGHIRNLDLQEAGAETFTPSDTAKASDSPAFKVSEPFSDSPHATDSPAFKVSEPFSDTAKATDSIAFKVFHAVNDSAHATDYIFPDHLTLEDSAHATVSVSYSYEDVIATPTENVNIYR